MGKSQINTQGKRGVLSALSRWLHEGIRIVFPEYCCICGQRLISGETFFCTSCLLSFPYTRIHGAPGNVVERLFWARLSVCRASALLRYEVNSVSKNPILKLKYGDRPAAGGYLGRMMAQDLSDTDFFSGIDAIVPVPLHRDKYRKRGYNQSEMLSRGISEKTGIPVWTDVVERTSNTSSQTHLTTQQRMENVLGKFRLLRPSLVRGKHLLLVDDVLTTGATVYACGQALSEGSDVRISVLVLALAGQHSRHPFPFADWRREE